MYATGGWSIEQKIYAYSKGTDVPIIPFPDPSKPCDAAAPEDCLISRIYSSTHPLPVSSDRYAYVCGKTNGNCTAAGDWTQVDLWSSGGLGFCVAGGTDFHGSGKCNANRAVISAKSTPVVCSFDAAAAQACNAAASGSGNLEDTKFVLAFDGHNTSTVNLRTRRDASGAYIHSQKDLNFSGIVKYAGHSTIIVESSSIKAVTFNGDFRTSTPASNSASTTFGKSPAGSPPGDALVFAVGPACKPSTPTACTSTPFTGGVEIAGSQNEINLVIYAHGSISNDTAKGNAKQSWYGLFVGDSITWMNNPHIYMVDRLLQYSPPGIRFLISKSFVVNIFRWREFF